MPEKGCRLVLKSRGKSLIDMNDETSINKLDCVTDNDALNFITKDESRVVRKLNDLIKEDFVENKFIIRSDVSFDDFKKTYINYMNEIKEWKNQLEIEFQCKFFMISARPKYVIDNDCSVYRHAIHISVTMIKKKKEMEEIKSSLAPVTPEEQIEACHLLLDQYQIPKTDRNGDGAGICIYNLCGRIKLALEKPKT